MNKDKFEVVIDGVEYERVSGPVNLAELQSDPKYKVILPKPQKSGMEIALNKYVEEIVLKQIRQIGVRTSYERAVSDVIDFVRGLPWDSSELNLYRAIKNWAGRK